MSSVYDFPPPAGYARGDSVDNLLERSTVQPFRIGEIGPGPHRSPSSFGRYAVALGAVH